MKLLEVVPIIRMGKGLPDSLSYYTSHDIPCGSLVAISIQKRKLVGIVTKSSSVAEVKTAIRKKDFVIHKIDGVIGEAIIPQTTIRLLAWCVRFFLTRKNYMARAALPAYFSKPTSALKKFASSCCPMPVFSWGNESFHSRTTPLFIEASYAVRIDRYVRELAEMVRQSFDAQALIIFPTVTAAHVFFEKAKKEFPGIIAFYGNTQTEKQNAEAWKTALLGIARIFIGTRSAVFAPLPNISLIIVDGEASPYYTLWDSSPRYDARDIAEKISEVSKARLIVGDSIPREETWYRIQEGFIKYERLKHTSLHAVTFIDTKKLFRESHTTISRENYAVISPPLAEKISVTLGAKKQIFLFSGRRGLASTIICFECGYTALCPQCSTPLVVHSARDILVPRILICHKCLKREAPPTRCADCGGARLQIYGIGTERVEAEARALFPDARIIRCDSDASDDPKEIFQKIADGAYDIVIGTELALKPEYIGNFDLSAIISFYQMLQQLDFRQEERIMRTVRVLQEITNGELIVQTASNEHSLIREIESGDVDAFFKRDIVFRKSFSYPPFAELIKITVKNPIRLIVEKNALLVKKIIENELKKTRVSHNALFIVGPFPAFIQKEKNEFIYSLMLKIKEDNGIIKEMLQRTLPDFAIAEVNPKNIL